MLDAEIDDLVAVIRQDNIDEVLADVVNIALDGRKHERSLFDAFDAVEERLQESDRRLHRLCRLQHERKLHLSGTKKVADRLHSVEQDIVDNIQRLVCFESLFQRVLKADLLALDYMFLKSLFYR